MAKFDTESFRDYFLTLFQTAMPAKIAEINTEKGGSIALVDIPAAAYVGSLNDKVLNFKEFILYMFVDVATPVSGSFGHSEEITMSFEVVIPEGNSVGNSTETKVMRYTRALAEIVAEAGKHPQISSVEVEVFKPVSLILQGGNPVRAAGIQVKGTIVG